MACPTIGDMNATRWTFATWDGTELLYRAWIPAEAQEKALLLFHRGHEHSAVVGGGGNAGSA